MTFDGQSLRRARETIGLSRSMFARIIGTTPSTVTRWEQGGEPQATWIYPAAQLLGVPIATLFAE